MLALISDLMMQSQVAAAAARAGAQVAFAASEDELIAKATTLQPRLVIVDLSHPALDPRRLMDRLGPALGSGVHCLAFGPHVHRERLEAAREAGFSSVVSRGQFHAQMDDLLRRFAD